MRHFNPSISRDFVRILNLKGESTDEVEDVLVPVIPIVRASNIVRHLTVSDSSGATIYTTPNDRDFYLTGFCISVCKDVNATSNYSAITCYVDGVIRYIGLIAGITLTAQQGALSLSFDAPIRIDRNTAIAIANSAGVANIKTSATIFGYTMDTQVSAGI